LRVFLGEVFFFMRPLRLLAPYDPDNGFPVLYHISSRVVEKRFIFNERERAKFLKLAKDHAAFSGFQLVSWCLMSNHFHLLVRVPVQDVEAIPDSEILERMERILSPTRMNRIVGRLEGVADEEERRGILGSFRKRIGHLPSYVKAVKQEFSQWFNFVNQREGTLWEGRYHSTIIEDTGGECPEDSPNGVGEIARIVASYIDMNPVRAKVESDPKDSGWSSYGAAIHGDVTALYGLRLLWGIPQNVQEGGAQEVMPGASGKLHLEAHRRWIMRTVDTINDLEEPSASAVSKTREDPGNQRGRPPHLTGLRRYRMLGSMEFHDRLAFSSSASRTPNSAKRSAVSKSP